MSVVLEPSSVLRFERPLTRIIKQHLTLKNDTKANSGQPVAFKVKTTAPKLYCVRPNSGRIPPGESVQVEVILQAMKEEPSTTTKCRDKFLVQSTVITPEKESMSLHDLWNNVPAKDPTVAEQKIRVVWLPDYGSVPEENEPDNSMMTQEGNSRYDTVRAVPNGHSPDNSFTPFPTESRPPIERAFSPDYAAANDEPHVIEETMEPITPPANASMTPVPMAQPPSDDSGTRAQLAAAQAEIQRLRDLLASVPEPSSNSTASELRRRNRVLSDDGTVVSSGDRDQSDVGTVVEQAVMQPEGVPPHIVVGISLLVFVLTYIFF